MEREAVRLVSQQLTVRENEHARAHQHAAKLLTTSTLDYGMVVADLPGSFTDMRNLSDFCDTTI